MELDDAALQANGWTITTHTRKTGGQAGGTYQTWLPPRGRKALRSRVEVRRHLEAQERATPNVGDRVVLKLDKVKGVVKARSRPGWFMVDLDGYEESIEFEAHELRVLPRAAGEPTPAAALPRGVEALLASDAFQLAAAFSGPRGLGALAAAGRALCRVDWAPAWRDLLEARFQLGEARFQLGRLHERDGLELACRQALHQANNDSWAPLAILEEYFVDGTPRDARKMYRLADYFCPILWRGPSNVDRSVVPMVGAAADGRFLPAAQALGVRFYFGEPFSRRRNVLRFSFTATEGPSGGLLDRAYVGLCVRPVADDASCQVQELDAMFLSSAGFGYGATLEGGSTSPEFSPAEAVDLGVMWDARGEISAHCQFADHSDMSRSFHPLNLRRLLRRDAGEVGVVPVVGVPVGAKATIAGWGCRVKNRRIEQFKNKMRRHSVPVPGDPAPAADETNDAERGDGAGAGNAAPSPAPAAAVDLTAGADFVVPPVRQSYTRRAPDDDAVPPHR